MGILQEILWRSLAGLFIVNRLMKTRKFWTVIYLMIGLPIAWMCVKDLPAPISSSSAQLETRGTYKPTLGMTQMSDSIYKFSVEIAALKAQIGKVLNPVEIKGGDPTLKFLESGTGDSWEFHGAGSGLQIKPAIKSHQVHNAAVLIQDQAGTSWIRLDPTAGTIEWNRKGVVKTFKFE